MASQKILENISKILKEKKVQILYLIIMKVENTTSQ